MKVRINIALKKAVLDTQGKAIENSLIKNLGYSQISNVRQGKFVDFEINETDENKIKAINVPPNTQVVFSKKSVVFFTPPI